MTDSYERSRSIRGGKKAFTHLHQWQASFWSRLSESTFTGCWEWLGKIGKNGYGVVSVMGNHHRTLYTHRVAYSMEFGEIPNNLFVCHKCDNRKCCNPWHLFLGTNHDNVRDMVNKGRASLKKIDPAKLHAVRVALIASGPRMGAAIAKDFGISKSMVSKIRKQLVEEGIL